MAKSTPRRHPNPNPNPSPTPSLPSPEGDPASRQQPEPSPKLARRAPTSPVRSSRYSASDQETSQLNWFRTPSSLSSNPRDATSTPSTISSTGPSTSDADVRGPSRVRSEQALMRLQGTSLQPSSSSSSLTSTAGSIQPSDVEKRG